jgi:hypothetical protein
MVLPPPPSWFARIDPSPFLRRRVVAIDSNVLVDHLEQTNVTDTLRFVFECPPSQLVLKLSRQSIEETIWDYKKDRAQRWGAVTPLVLSGKIMLLGHANLPPSARTIYTNLVPCLERTNFSKKDARVLADSLVFRLHLYTKERETKMPDSVRTALKNSAVMELLQANGLATQYDDILVT